MAPKTRLVLEKIVDLRERAVLEKPTKPEEISDSRTYTLEIKFGRKKKNQGDDLTVYEFNEQKQLTYRHLRNRKQAELMMELLSQYLSPATEDYPLLAMVLTEETFSKEDLDKIGPKQYCSLDIIMETVVDGQETEENPVYFFNGRFVREAWYCDIIKGFDYELFWDEKSPIKKMVDKNGGKI